MKNKQGSYGTQGIENKRVKDEIMEFTIHWEAEAKLFKSIVQKKYWRENGGMPFSESAIRTEADSGMLPFTKR
jgi:hypothetical protein